MRDQKKRISPRNFYQRTNIITLLLLVYILLLLVNTAKLSNKLGQEEMDQSIAEMTGSGVAEVSLKILNGTATGDAGTTTTEAAAESTKVLTTGGSSLKLSTDLFALDLYHGEEQTYTVTVQNVLDTTISLQIVTTMGDYVKVKPGVIVLKPDDGEDGGDDEDDIVVTFTGSSPGLVTGTILLKDVGIKGFIPFSLDISTKQLTGSVQLTLPEMFSIVAPGSPFIVHTYLSNFNPGIIELVYFIKDYENNELLRTIQTMNIASGASFDKTLELPETIKDGAYVLGLEVRRGGLTLTDSLILTVGTQQQALSAVPGQVGPLLNKTLFRLVVLAVMLLIILSFVLYSHEIQGIPERPQRKK